MGPDRGDGCILILLFDRLEHCFVSLKNTLYLGLGMNLKPANPVEMSSAGTDKSMKVFLANPVEKDPVKILVELLKKSQLVAIFGDLALKLDHRPPVADDIRRTFAGQTAHDFGFESNSQEMCLVDLGNVDPGHQRSGLRENLDKVVLFQLLQRIPKGCLANLVFGGQFRPQQAGSRRQIEREDALPQIVVDPTGCRRPFAGSNLPDQVAGGFD